jgi:hypothetical protein
MKCKEVQEVIEDAHVVSTKVRILNARNYFYSRPHVSVSSKERKFPF